MRDVLQKRYSRRAGRPRLIALAVRVGWVRCSRQLRHVRSEPPLFRTSHQRQLLLDLTVGNQAEEW
jgi:hypothetical protein